MNSDYYRRPDKIDIFFQYLLGVMFFVVAISFIILITLSILVYFFPELKAEKDPNANYTCYQTGEWLNPYDTCSTAP